MIKNIGSLFSTLSSAFLLGDHGLGVSIQKDALCDSYVIVPCDTGVNLRRIVCSSM